MSNLKPIMDALGKWRDASPPGSESWLAYDTAISIVSHTPTNDPPELKRCGSCHQSCVRCYPHLNGT